MGFKLHVLYSIATSEKSFEMILRYLIRELDLSLGDQVTFLLSSTLTEHVCFPLRISKVDSIRFNKLVLVKHDQR